MKRQNELIFNAIIKSIDDLIFEVSVDGLFKNVWIHDEKLLFMPKENFINQHYSSILPPVISEQIQTAIKAIEITQKPQQFEYQNPFVEDKNISPWFRCRVNKISNNKNTSFTLVITEITEQKIMQNETLSYIQEIKDLKKRYKDLIQHSPAVVYECLANENWTMIYVSPQIEKLTGYPPEDFINDQIRTFASIYHPEDLKRVQELAIQSMNDQKPFDIQYRIICKDQSIKWIWERGSFKSDTQTFVGVLMDITEQKMSELNFQKTQSELDNFFNVSLDVLAIANHQGRFVRVNKTFETLLGYSMDEMTNQSLMNFIHPEDHEATLQEAAKLAQGLKSINFENRYLCKDGSTKLLSWVCTPDPATGLLYAAAHDVTDIRRYQNQLEEAQLVTQVGSWNYDLKQQKIYWSKQMYTMFYQPTQQPAPSIETQLQFIHPDERQVWRNSFQMCMANATPFKIRYRVIFKEKTMWVETIGHAKTNKNGLPIEIYGTCQDISELIAMEEKLAQERAIAQHTAKLASLGEMASGIAHEINNPLAIINGSLQQLVRKADNPELFQSKIETMKKSVNRIAKIVKGLRKFSRTSDKNEFKLEILGTIIQEAIVLTETKAKHANVTIQQNIEYSGTVNCDMIEIEQVFVNLINNAIDAIQETDNPWLQIHIFQNEQNIICRFIDSGHGITPEVEQRLFEPFFTTKAVGHGTGLGLSTSKGILEDHNAKFFLNREFKNTCFEIQFPQPVVEEKSTAA